MLVSGHRGRQLTEQVDVRRVVRSGHVDDGDVDTELVIGGGIVTQCADVIGLEPKDHRVGDLGRVSADVVAMLVEH